MPATAESRALFLGERPPVAYRAILLGRDGAVVRTVEVFAGDDDRAIGRAKALVDGHAVDLWDGLRFIAHFASIA